MTTLKDLIERECEELSQKSWLMEKCTREGCEGCKWEETEFLDLFRQSLETIAKETANAYKAKREEEFFSSSNKVENDNQKD